MIPGVELLPTGFELPPTPYLAGLVLGVVVVGVLLVLFQPPVTQWDVVALGSWMAVGSALHALHQVGAFPGSVAPLFAAPAVYLTTFIVAGLVWLVATVGTAAETFSAIPRIVGVVGLTVTLALTGYLSWLGFQAGTIDPVWPIIGVVASVGLAALAFIALSLTYTDAVAITGKAGAFVLFAHTLDGVTTAIGVDVLGAGERSPVPRAIMEFSAGLPTAQYVGEGWLFVLVKVLLAMVVVALFTDYVRDVPARGYLVLTGVAAVGFGPGVYNLLLYLVSAMPA